MFRRCLLMLSLLLALPVYAGETGDTACPHDDLSQEIAVQHDNRIFNPALQNVGIDLCAALILLSNTFGRLACSTYFGYKTYLHIQKAWKADAAHRNQYISKALCYAGAVALLLHDGYRWILEHGSRA